MNIPSHNHALSRRAALAGFGTAGLGLALANSAHPTAAQDTAAMASHPLVGAWVSDPIPEIPTLVSYSHFHADGTWSSVHTFAGPGMGTWQATGEHTCEAILKYLNIASEWGVFQPGTVTVWSTIEVDASGNHYTEEAIIDFRGPDGAFIEQFPFTGHGTRMVIAPPPLATPEAATPES